MCAAGLPIGALVATLALGLLVGYIAGRRKALAAAIVQALQQGQDAAQKLISSSKDDEDEDDIIEEEEVVDSTIFDFLDSSSAPGLDDHPATVVNPILLMQLRKKQAELRHEVTIQNALAQAGYTKEFLDSLEPDVRQQMGEDLLLENQTLTRPTVGSVANYDRKWGSNINASLILHSVGATFLPTAINEEDLDLDERATLEVRERVKLIGSHLSTHMGVDVSRQAYNAGKRQLVDGKRLKDALTVANETKHTPFVATREPLTFEEQRDFAQRGRLRVAHPEDDEEARDKQVNKVLSALMKPKFGTVRTQRGSVLKVNNMSKLSTWKKLQVEMSMASSTDGAGVKNEEDAGTRATRTTLTSGVERATRTTLTSGVDVERGVGFGAFRDTDFNFDHE